MLWWILTSVDSAKWLLMFFFFTIQNFSPNPFFEDTKLTKTFTFLDEGITKISATSIKWKDGMVLFLCPCTFRHISIICFGL